MNSISARVTFPFCSVVVFQGCLYDVFRGILSVFLGCFKGGLWVIKGVLRSILRVLQGCFQAFFRFLRAFLGVLHGCFKVICKVIILLHD